MSGTSLYYVKLYVGDPEALAPFYCAVLGMKEVRRIYEPDHVRPHLEIYLSPGPTDNDNQIVLMRYLNRPPATPGEASIALKVENVDSAVAAALAAGGATIHPAETLEQYNFRWATIADPEGHTLELMQFGV